MLGQHCGADDGRCRFVDYQEWRKKTCLDDLVPTWDYKERDELFQYYPQYYHKTDKVCVA